LSNSKRAQVDDDSFDEQAELDLTGGENDLANIVVSDGEGEDAHGRVVGRLAAFKKNLIDKANEIKAAGEWDLLLDYVVFGAGKATDMPVWDNEDHNKSRKAAIKKFTDLANTVIKKLKKEKNRGLLEALQREVS
jgi:hypothetical protein